MKLHIECGTTATGPCPVLADGKLVGHVDQCCAMELAEAIRCHALLDCAQGVVDSWEGGDLALAVRKLDAAIKSVKGGE